MATSSEPTLTEPSNIAERGMDRPEQDKEGGDELPTYDDLAEQNGPNSRFGRWKGWIEKRAAERYADITPEDLRRRRARGWGNSVRAPAAQVAQPLDLPIILNQPPTPTPSSSQSGPILHLQTNFNLPIPLPSPPLFPEEEEEEPHPLVGQPLEPTHLTFNEIGSRFLPHTTAPIRTLLPLLGDKLLLIGHDDGLSVLNMFPQEWSDTGLRNKGPSEAEAHLIWKGEGVYQMSILEVEDTGESTPQGVLLALVGPETENEQEPVRTLRMYNLASIISLAKWAVSQKGAKPVDLRRPATWHPQQTPPKKHRPQSSLAKGLKSLMTDSPTNIRDCPPSQEASSSYQKMLSPSTPKRPTPVQRSSSDSGWDMVDDGDRDLPLRWATDYVPLASGNSRLVNTSLLSYALWRDDRRARGGALLAVATKSSILLYESPKGERAFRFVKDFYTPMAPRHITFVLQNAPDIISRSPSDVTGSLKHTSHPLGHARMASHGTPHGRQRNSAIRVFGFGNQLSLFVVFEKKAGMIRLADSAVGEIELCDPNFMSSRDTLSLPVPPTGASSGRRSRSSFDGHAFAKEIKGLWSPPSRGDLPVVSGRYDVNQPVYFLTRGKKTHILPCPLPVNLHTIPPLKVITWNSHPTYVTHRAVQPESREGNASLQLIAFGEDGLEVQEISLSFLVDQKEKGRAEEPLRAQTDFGGDMGYLCAGGLWHRPYDAPLQRSYSTSSSISGISWDSTDTEEIVARIQGEQGIYGWQRKGIEDWRIFWVGGLGSGNSLGASLD